MIIHGRKQISEMVYARRASEGGGAVRLTNMIRGAQVVFGGLGPSWFKWLTKAIQAAIVGAFGGDGWAVIKATNAYLNGIAATDPTKAQALAAFINEDPMMVCSLGLSVEGVTMPIRTLNGDGTAWINTGFLLNDGHNLKMTVRASNMQQDITLCGAGAVGGSFYVGIIAGKHYYAYNYYDVNTNVTAYTDHDYTMIMDNILGSYSVYDHTTRQMDYSTTFNPVSRKSAKPLILFAYATGQTSVLNAKPTHIAYAEIERSNGDKKHFVPFKKKDGDNVINCMLDLEAIGVDGATLFYYNGAANGQFTIPDIVYPTP